MQQVLSRMMPDGVYMDADGLAEIDLGNGTNYNPQEALNMFFQTGSVIGRSFTSEGDMNPAKCQFSHCKLALVVKRGLQTLNYKLITITLQMIP